ncbi:hypothetical protein MCOR25_009582 [Pyricularia grisea]|uniref:Uncharacterized protein n=1 Tax=Pyricularia grisea TaxID=148305 RepID=A0A6P8B5H8_PYRGI|nr:hypothetical protein PgNI_05372 [Pyricularia grisea]KAI6352042.1 hypothetical protein MCOR25_009582 [Pyricularia grisea]TLD10510.1 hypothetical protein PgNI_05372 [Pyricularia grisea]
MRFETLAIFTFASLAVANKPNPWDPLDVRPLKRCQADCVKSTLPKLGEGKFVILQTPNEYFCASPDLKTWLRDDLFPCGAISCGRKTELYAKRGMTWLRNTCPTITFTESEFASPSGQPAGEAPTGSSGAEPSSEPSGSPEATPTGSEGSEPTEGAETGSDGSE